MSDLTKAFDSVAKKKNWEKFEADKLQINTRLTELNTQMTQNQTDIADGMGEFNTRVQTLETFKTSYDNSNKSGSKQYIKGDLQVNEKAHFIGDVTGEGSLNFEGAIKSGGNVLATENFVLSNASGGAAGNVDVTNTYRFEATDGQTEFEFHFVGNSVAVYLGGLKLDTTDYSLTQAEYDDEGNVTTESKVTLESGASEGEIFHGVAFGGADFYSKTQADAKYETLVHAAETFATKTDLTEAVTSSYCTCSFDSLTSDRVKDSVLLPIIAGEKTDDYTIDEDNDTITVAQSGMYYIAWNIETQDLSVIDSGNWYYAANLYVNDDMKTGFDTYSIDGKYNFCSYNRSIRLAAGDVITFKCHDNGNKLVLHGGNQGQAPITIIKIGE